LNLNAHSEHLLPMKDPPHVGGFIRRENVEPLRLTVTDAARVLGVTRQTLNNLLNEKSALPAEMALRIEKAFGPKMDHLLRMQLEYDIAQARKREAGRKVRKFVRAA
jgi:addiction module HigA family antidote